LSPEKSIKIDDKQDVQCYLRTMKRISPKYACFYVSVYFGMIIEIVLYSW